MTIQQTQTLRQITFRFEDDGSLSHVFQHEDRQLHDDETGTVLSSDTLVSTLYDVTGASVDVEALRAALADIEQKVAALLPEQPQATPTS